MKNYLPKWFPSFRITHVAMVIAAMLFSCGGQKSDNKSATAVQLTEEEKRSPENALAGMELYEGLDATLFAHEPMLINPTNFDIDARGRVWVCEARNYRPKLNAKNEYSDEGDRIVILEDTDGDGKADSQKVFYQGTEVDAALGIAVLGNKVYVSASPHLYIFTDEDGDDVADSKEILFSGISGNQHDHGLHAVTFGPDGKLYFNFGNAGGQLKDKNGNLVTDINGLPVTDDGKPFRQGMAFRCNPDGTELEVLGHNFRNPYELATDAFGNVWQSDNDDDGNRGVRINFVMEYGNYGYKDELTGANWRTRRTGMHEEIPKQHWHQNDPGSIPNMLQTGAGSPAGLMVYEGELLPEVFQGQIIHAEAGTNVVRAYPVQPKAAGYKAEIVNIAKAGADNWFRPVDVCAAPDGSLFIADWYDPGVGGHQAGDQQQGRIFRIAPPKTGYDIQKPDTGTAEGAAKALTSPNQATRYLGWTALQQMGEKAVPALEKLVQNGNEHAKARALWCLASMQKQYIDLALQDENPAIRYAGVRMARRFAPGQLASYLQPLTEDPSPQVLREVLVALRYLNSPKAADMWVELAKKYDGKDRWYLEALGLAADPRADEFMKKWLQEAKWNTPAGQDIVWRMRSKEALPLLAKLATHPAATPSLRNRYFRAFDFHSAEMKDELLNQMLTADLPEQEKIDFLVLNHISKQKIKESPAAMQKLQALLKVTRQQNTEQYLEWVSRYELDSEVPELEKIYRDPASGALAAKAAQTVYQLKGLSFFTSRLQQGSPAEVTATLEAMKHLWGKEAWDQVKDFALDASNSLNLRKKATETLAVGWQQENWLLQHLKDGLIPEELQNSAATALTAAYKSSVREQALAFTGAGQNAAEMPDIKELVKLDGAAASGATVFEAKCASCHVVNGNGINFGPALSEIGDKLSKDGLYAAILYPDAGISFGYEGYVVKTVQGQTLVGYISSRTETEIEVTSMGGVKTVVAATDVASTKELENSLMTSGLHRTMSQQELVDLVSYLTTLKKSSKLAVN